MYINDFINEYKEGDVIVDGQSSYSLRELLGKIRRAFHGRFEKDFDESGLKKLYINTGFNLWFALHRGTKVQTKDLQMRSLNYNSLKVVPLLRGMLRTHLNRTDFSEFIEENSANGIRDGSAVCKVVNGALKNVELMNLIVPPHVNDIQSSELVEMTYLTYEEMEEEKEKWRHYWKKEKLGVTKNEDMIKRTWEGMQGLGQNEFVVYEHWKRDRFDAKMHKGCVKYLDTESINPREGKDRDDFLPQLELIKFKTPFEITNKKHTKRKMGEELYPYRKWDMITVPNRFLGFGVFELVLGLSEYINENVNLKRKLDLINLRGNYIHTKRADQPSISQEFLQNLETGAVLSLEENESIQRLAPQNVTNEVLNTVSQLFDWQRQITGISQAGAGQELPSSMPATLGVMQQQEQQGTFSHVIGQKSKFLTDLFEDFYMEEVIDQINEKEVVDIVGDSRELRELDEYYVNIELNKRVHEAQGRGEIVTAEDYEMTKQRLLQELEQMGDTRFSEIKKSIIKKLQYTIEFNVDNEKFDKNVVIKWIEQELMNPMTPLSRERLAEMKFELAGVPVLQLKKTQKEKEEEAQQAQMAQMQQGNPKMPLQGQPTQMAQDMAQANQVNNPNG